MREKPASMNNQNMTPEAILNFNIAPTSYIDPGWYDEIEHGALMSVLSENVSARPHVSQQLLAAYDLTEKYYTDFSRPRARLALMDREALQNLLLHVGLSLRYTEIRGVLDGTRLTALRNSIGPGPMDFALRSASLFAPVSGFSFQSDLADPRERFILVGAAYTLDAQASESPTWFTRILWKLPPAVSDPLRQFFRTLVRRDDDGALPSDVRRLIREITPLWLHLFD